MRVEEIMTTPVVAVTPKVTLGELSDILVRNDISGVPVINDDSEVIGIVSEADLLPFEMKPDAVTKEREFHRTRAAERRVGEIMQRSVFTLPRDAEAIEAAHMIVEKNVKRVPIVSKGRLVGIVTRHDILEVLTGAP